MREQAFLDQFTELVFREDKPERADVIFIPGSGLPQLGEEAARLYREGYAPYVLPSGRYSVLAGCFQGVQEKEELYGGTYETEWEFLKEVLIRNQVPEEAILLEDRATYTYENAIYSRRVTDERGLLIRRAILCCKPYHARRSLLYYQLLYPETEFFVCPVKESRITRENWYKTKEGTEAVFGELTRMGTQFYEILRELRETEGRRKDP